MLLRNHFLNTSKNSTTAALIFVDDSQLPIGEDSNFALAGLTIESRVETCSPHHFSSFSSVEEFSVEAEDGVSIILYF